MSFVNTSTPPHVAKALARDPVAELKRIDAAPEIPTPESACGFEATPWLDWALAGTCATSSTG